MSDKKKEDLKALASEWEVNTLIRAISLLAEAEGKAKWSTYPEVFLELALVKLCEPSMDASLEGIMDRLSRLEDMAFKGVSAGSGDKAPAGGELPPAAEDNSIVSPGEGAGKPDKSRDSETVSKATPRQNKKSDAANEKEKDKVLENAGSKGDGRNREEPEGRENLQRTAPVRAGTYPWRRWRPPGVTCLYPRNKKALYVLMGSADTSKRRHAGGGMLSPVDLLRIANSKEKPDRFLRDRCNR